MSLGARPQPTEYPTDQDWQRLVAAIGRLGDQVDDAGRADLHAILDFIEKFERHDG